ncbi:MAG: UvrD-helicase domain-containing protein [Bacteroidota bacterium]|nr:UvrD-helicase domain-containing protein [Bacteroidota bacterium]
MIYKASAGSGKTFQLASQYLQIVIQDPKNYRSILAVTFTNKATAEMKDRILSELYNLSSGLDSKYLEQLQTETGFNEEKIRERAGMVLNGILHDYSRFAISTIDSFFQKVIRGFSREIGLQGGYDIELDSNRVLEEVIDLLLMNLDENDGLRHWLLEFAEDLLKEGKSWNFRQTLFDFAGELFQEAYKELDDQVISKISDKEFMKDFRAKVSAQKKGFENKLKDIGTRGVMLMKQHDLSVDDFKQKNRGVGSFITRLADPSTELLLKGPNAYVLKAATDYSEWYSPKSPGTLISRIETALNDGLFECLNEAIQYWDQNLPFYVSADAVLKNLYTLGVLTDLSRQLKSYCQENNVLLLADSTELLRKIIGPSDTPFVYEKLGSHFRNYMIDEFQDTSGLQWDNLRPLVEDALSEDKQCLVVGDVKQSIYRWRNGDWKLLAGRISEELGRFGPDEISLNRNWRSSRNVVRFNNAFFSIAPQLLQGMINNELDEGNVPVKNSDWFRSILVNAYQDHHQKFRDDAAEGMVRIEFAPEERESSGRGNSTAWRESALVRMTEVIKELQDQNVAPGDIAILVRKASDGRDVAEWLIQEKMKDSSGRFCYDVISNDSLLISSSPTVRFLTAFLKYIHDPEDEINKTFLYSEYIRYIYPILSRENRVPPHLVADTTGQVSLFAAPSADLEENLHPLFSNEAELVSRIFPFFTNPTEEIPKYFKMNSLYEGVQEVITWFGLNNLDSDLPFIQAFLDEIIAFGKSEYSDLGGFLEWWSVQGAKHTINASEKQDAIRIITIHKSKGLEFKAVLIPFCDWDLNPRSGDVIWCKPEEAPFNELKLLPVKYNNQLAGSVFAYDYYLEKVQTWLDNLNLFYVAFTRAEDFLWTYAPQGKKDKTISRMGSLQYAIVSGASSLTEKDSIESFTAEDFQLDKNLCFHKGQISFSEAGSVKDESAKLSLKGISVSDFSSRLQLKNHSEGYFILDDNHRFAGLNEGMLIHELLSGVKAANDLDKAIHQMISDGRITQEQGAEYEIRIRKLLSDPQVKDWFDSRWEIYNERTVILPGGETKRPDRVMINGSQVVVVDFKSGEKESKSHYYQVLVYLKLFREMGYSNVTGYLWYLYNNKIVTVK